MQMPNKTLEAQIQSLRDRGRERAKTLGLPGLVGTNYRRIAEEDCPYGEGSQARREWIESFVMCAQEITGTHAADEVKLEMLPPWATPGTSFKFPNLPRSHARGPFHIRAIVDGQMVIAQWSDMKKRYNYRVETPYFLTLRLRDGERVPYYKTPSRRKFDDYT